MTSPDHPDAELTTAEVAKRLRCSTQTARRYRTRGHFPHAWKTDGQWRIPVTDVTAFLAQRLEQATNG